MVDLPNLLGYYRKVLLSAYAKHFMRKPNILSVDATLDLIIRERYSISRNGDGEFLIMLGEGIPFQKADARLAAMLREAMAARCERYISALPNIFNGYGRFNKFARDWYDYYLKIKRYDCYRFAKADVYGDAFISRFYMDLVDKSSSRRQVDRLKQIWAGRDVVLVEGRESRLGVNNDLFAGARSMLRILGPAENAFEFYEPLMNKVRESASADTLILLALGPTATAMAYQLAKEGYQGVDIGHIDIEYEWMLMGADRKVPVPGKYTNESTDGKLVGELPIEAVRKYEDEIIARIY